MSYLYSSPRTIKFVHETIWDWRIIKMYDANRILIPAHFLRAIKSSFHGQRNLPWKLQSFLWVPQTLFRRLWCWTQEVFSSNPNHIRITDHNLFKFRSLNSATQNEYLGCASGFSSLRQSRGSGAQKRRQKSNRNCDQEYQNTGRFNEFATNWTMKTPVTVADFRIVSGLGWR